LLRRQRLECDQCNLVLDPKPHRQPVQIGEYRSNVITSAGLVTTLASVFCRRCNLSMLALWWVSCMHLQPLAEGAYRKPTTELRSVTCHMGSHSEHRWTQV